MIPVCIIPTLIQYDLLETMISSVDHPIHELIIIDNGGKLKHAPANKYIAKTHIINLPNNIGVAASWNLGIKLTPYAKWWLIASDDIAWNPGALEKYAQAIGQMTMVADWDLDRSFSAFGIDAGTIAMVGLFDDYYYPGVGEEFNYMHRARHSSITFRHITFAYTTRAGNTRNAIKEMNPEMDDIFTTNWNSAHAVGGLVRGWNLHNRRKCEVKFR